MTATSLQRGLSSVLKVAVVEKVSTVIAFFYQRARQDTWGRVEIFLPGLSSERIGGPSSKNLFS